MKPTSGTYFKIGLFVIAGTLLVVAGVIVLGGGAFFKNEFLAETYFDSSVQGLEVGSPVKYRGIQIGTVKQITDVYSIYSVGSPYVVVIMSLYADRFGDISSDEFNELVREDVEAGIRVRLSYQGITGGAFLEADYFNPKNFPPLKARWKPNNPYIPSAPSTITQLSESLSRIMRSLEKIDVNKVLGNLESIVASVNSTLNELNVGEVTTEAKMLLTEVRDTNRMIQDVLLEAKKSGMIGNAAGAAASAKNLMDSAEKPLVNTAQSLESAAAGMNRISAKLEPVVKSLPGMVTRLQVTLKRLDNLVMLPQGEIETTLQNIRSISDNLKRLTSETQKHPSRLLFGDPPTRRSPGGGK